MQLRYKILLLITIPVLFAFCVSFLLIAGGWFVEWEIVSIGVMDKDTRLALLFLTIVAYAGGFYFTILGVFFSDMFNKEIRK